MADNVVELDDHRPHYVIRTLDGNMHVLPKVLLDNIVKGTQKVTDVDDWEEIVRAIIYEWQRNLGPTRTD